MFDLVDDDDSRRTFPLNAVLLLSISLSLAATYVFWPRMHRRWPDMIHMAFWAGVLVSALFSLGQIAWSTVPAAWKRQLPRFQRHRAFIAKEGLAYIGIMIVLFIGSALTHSNMLMLVFASMVGPFIVNGLVTLSMLKSIDVRRSLPRRAMAGELFSVEIELLNRSSLLASWLISVEDEVVHDATQLQPAILFTRVPPRSSLTGHYQLRLVERGRHVLGPIEARTRFPLGLVERWRTFTEAGETLIYPRIGRLTSRWKRQLLTASELIEQPQSHSGVFDDEFHHLREYRPGDNPRAIHWRSSARRGQLILREYQQNRENNLTVIVDLFQPVNPSAQERLAIEPTLSLVTTLCWEHRQQCRGAQLTVVAVGQTSWRWEGGSRAASGFEELLDRLALIAPGTSADFPRILQETLSQESSTTRVVVISTRAKPTNGAAAGKNGNLSWFSVQPDRIGEILRYDESPVAPRHAVSEAVLPQPEVRH